MNLPPEIAHFIIYYFPRVGWYRMWKNKLLTVCLMVKERILKQKYELVLNFLYFKTINTRLFIKMQPKELSERFQIL